MLQKGLEKANSSLFFRGNQSDGLNSSNFSLKVFVSNNMTLLAISLCIINKRENTLRDGIQSTQNYPMILCSVMI